MHLLNHFTLASATLLLTISPTLAAPTNNTFTTLNNQTITNQTLANQTLANQTPTNQTLTKRAHDWHECTKIKVTGRSANPNPNPYPPVGIPAEVSGQIFSTLTCSPSPFPNYEDVHCGNVLEVIKQFCRAHTAEPARVIEGYKYFKHEDYITGWENAVHLTYTLKDHVDDFVVNVAKVQPCLYDDVDWERIVPNVYERCAAALWGAWTECDNKGRGGSMVASCYNYTLAVVE